MSVVYLTYSCIPFSIKYLCCLMRLISVNPNKDTDVRGPSFVYIIYVWKRCVSIEYIYIYIYIQCCLKKHARYGHFFILTIEFFLLLRYELRRCVAMCGFRTEKRLCILVQSMVN
jgi:hypothetical protein